MAIDVNVLKDYLGVAAIEVIQLRSEKIRLEQAVAQAEPRIEELQQRIAALVHQDDPQEEPAPAEPGVVAVSEHEVRAAIENGVAEYEADMAKVRNMTRRRAAGGGA